MLISLLLFLIFGGLIVELFQKYILGIKKPEIEDLWCELSEKEWFKVLENNPDMREWIKEDKKNGLLSDPDYVRKIMDKEVHRKGFIKYITQKVVK